MSSGFKLGALVSFGVVCLAGVAAGQTLAALKQKISEARAIGLPILPEDLRLPPVADDENGAVLVEQVAQMLRADPANKSRLDLIKKTRTSTATEADHQLAMVVVDTLKPEMDLLAKATDRPACRFAIDWSHLGATNLSHLDIIDEFVLAFCVRAEEKSEKGDASGALADIQIGHRVSGLLEGNPMRVNSTTECQCDLGVEQAFHRILDAHRADVPFLTAAKKMHDTFGPIPDFQSAFRAQLVYALMRIDQMTMPSEFGIQKGDLDVGDWTTNITKSDKNSLQIRTLAAYTSFFSVLPKKFEKWEVVFDVADSAFQLFRPEQQDASDGALAMLNSMDRFAWDYVLAGYARDQTMRRLNDTSILLLLQITQTGKAPDGLPEFGVSCIDPFSGNLLRYQSSGKGFTLASVGAGRLSDGTELKGDEVIFD